MRSLDEQVPILDWFCGAYKYGIYFNPFNGFDPCQLFNLNDLIGLNNKRFFMPIKLNYGQWHTTITKLTMGQRLVLFHFPSPSMIGQV
jgi:hypothetical protein